MLGWLPYPPLTALALQQEHQAQASCPVRASSPVQRQEQALVPPVVPQEMQQQASKTGEASLTSLVQASLSVALVRRTSIRSARLVPTSSGSEWAVCGERCPIRYRRDARLTARQTSIRWGLRLLPCQSP
jgi:hypothetical protein